MQKSSILELARRRKTVRKFSSSLVNLNEVLLALEAACQAPSGANTQPWRFVIVTDPQKKRRIREICENGEKEFYSKVRGELRGWLLSKGFSWKKPFLEEAPLLVLVFSEKKAPYSTHSVWLAIGYILLALEELGLSTVTYTPSNPTGILDEVNAPEEFRLEAILPIGFSADEKAKESRFSALDVSFLNSWSNPIPLK